MYIKSNNIYIKMINKSIITEQNKHWITNKVNPAYFKEFKRDIYNKIKAKLGNNRILILKGLRRTGKTTLLFQLIDYILKKDTPSKNIMYFSFDQTGADLKEIIEFFSEEVLKNNISNQKIYLFLDEVQKLADWQNKVKLYHDTYFIMH